MEERNYKLYVHINKINGKRYYGITKQEPKKRWNSGHGYKFYIDKKGNKHGNKHFWNSICKYGWKNFEHIVLFDNLTEEEAKLMEQMYIALYDTTDIEKGYNSTLGGEGGNGNKWTEEQRQKRSERMKILWEGKSWEKDEDLEENYNYTIKDIEKSMMIMNSREIGGFTRYIFDTYINENYLTRKQVKFINDCLNNYSDISGNIRDIVTDNILYNKNSASKLRKNIRNRLIKLLEEDVRVYEKNGRYNVIFF